MEAATKFGHRIIATPGIFVICNSEINDGACLNQVSFVTCRVGWSALGMPRWSWFPFGGGNRRCALFTQACDHLSEHDNADRQRDIEDAGGLAARQPGAPPR